jgi:asparagine synthase (glutamine-hydrolysing)
MPSAGVTGSPPQGWFAIDIGIGSGGIVKELGGVSGICGILRFGGAPCDRRDLDRQIARLAHRGRDRSRSWTDGPVGLAHLMTRITREDRFDVQPLHDDHMTLVADLRLDNREALAEALSIGPAALAEMADSSLLWAAYRQWGAACVEHLIGDFVFAVWEADKQTLTLARDHMGQRHVFFHKGDDFLAFAAEIKGLWALPEVPRELCETHLIQALCLDFSGEPGRTDFEGVWGVPGGTVMTIGADGAVTSRRYWEPRADPAHVGRDEAYYVKAYREVLTEAVACRLRRSEYSAGLLMGGGFDSSAICALAGPVVTSQGRKFVAAASVMPDDYRGGIHHARPWVEICRRDMPHLDVRYVTGEGGDILGGLEGAFLSVDTRHGGARYITHALFAEVASTGARIVMDGHGGDYTLNPRGQDALARFLLKGQLRRFTSEFNAMRRHLRQSVKQTLVRNVLLPLIPASWMRIRNRRNNGLRLFGPTMPVSDEVIRSRPKANGRSDSTPRGEMEAVLRVQQNYPAPGSAVVAASKGLEFTQPFHDKRVVELGLAIPEELHVKNGRTRHLARVALADLYPREYQDRRPGNDSVVPGFLAMAKRVEPRVLAEIDRMEQAGRLSKYFDFARMRAMLTRRAPDQHANGGESDTQQAANAFLVARYIEWFRGDNA